MGKNGGGGMDTKTIIALVTGVAALLGGSNVANYATQAAPAKVAAEKYQASSDEWGQMWRSVLDTSNTCHNDLRACYQECTHSDSEHVE